MTLEIHKYLYFDITVIVMVVQGNFYCIHLEFVETEYNSVWPGGEGGAVISHIGCHILFHLPEK